ncbi:MAG: DUF4416 family protein, partial [Planctomycetota bacterium]
MWEIQDIQPVKLIVGILACDESALEVSRQVLLDAYGGADLISEVEQDLARQLDTPYPRPVNFDPGIIEPSKLILASTKNFAHRIY